MSVQDDFSLYVTRGDNAMRGCPSQGWCYMDPFMQFQYPCWFGWLPVKITPYEEICVFAFVHVSVCVYPVCLSLWKFVCVPLSTRPLCARSCVSISKLCRKITLTMNYKVQTDLGWSKVQKPTLVSFSTGLWWWMPKDINHSRNNIKDTNNIDNTYDNIIHISPLESFCW